jgi:hypothetical protein
MIVTDSNSLRLLGVLEDPKGRLYDVLEIVTDTRTYRVVIQHGILASTRRFRSRLLALGILLPSEGGLAAEVVAKLREQRDPPVARIVDTLGWCERSDGQPVFVLDEGYVDPDGWRATVSFDGGPIPRQTVDPRDIAVVSDSALWQPVVIGASWAGYDRPPSPPRLSGWRPHGSLPDWASWFSNSHKTVRTVIAAALAPAILRRLDLHDRFESVVAIVGRRGTLPTLQSAVSPWAGPRDGVFWPDARLQDLERHAVRMGELPLAFQEADATTRSKIYNLVGQLSTGLTRGRTNSAGDLLPTGRLRGCVLLECSRSIMTPESGLQDTTLEFRAHEAATTPQSHGLAGPHLAQAAMSWTISDLQRLRDEFASLKQMFGELRRGRGFEPSRTWRLDARHAAVELTHRLLTKSLAIEGLDCDSYGLFTEWEEPMSAAGDAEAQRPKPR